MAAQYTIRVTPELAVGIERAAEAEHRSPANYIRHVLMEHLAGTAAPLVTEPTGPGRGEHFLTEA